MNRISRWFFLLAILVFCAPSVRAQAWLPDKGQGSVTLSFISGKVEDHLFDDTPALLPPFLPPGFEDLGLRKIDLGDISTRTALAQFTYAFTGKLAIDADLAYVSAKYEGSFPENPEIDNGEFHSSLQDARIRLRWKAYDRGVVLTPEVGVVFPTADYDDLGHASQGRHVNEAFVGLAVGTILGHESPSGYFQGSYKYSFVESVDDQDIDRSNLLVEFGYFVNRKLVLRTFLAYQNTHGGLNWSTDLADPDHFESHDVAANADFWGIGFEGVIAVASEVDLILGVGGIVDGINTHELRSFRVGVRYNFGRRFQFAPPLFGTPSTPDAVPTTGGS